MFLVFGVVPVCSLGYDVMRISGGSHFTWMIGLYLIGGYIRTYCAPDTDKKHRWLLGYFLFALIHLAYMIGMNAIGLGSWSGLFLTNVSPLVLGSAVCLFGCFRDMGSRIPTGGMWGKLLRFVTPGIYSVYVIHVHPKVFWSQDIIALFRAWDSRSALWIFGAMVLTALAVFWGCILLDAVRQRLFRVLGIDRGVDRLSDWAEQKIRERVKD